MLKKLMEGKTEKDYIFYVGMQRCGTKSFGEFFNKNHYAVCSWEQIASNNWLDIAHDGNYLEIINSKEFNSYQVFEDGPFYRIEFIKFLYHYLPKSKFVYYYRPPSDWFKSMISHSEGQTLGENKKALEIHCHLYDRLQDYLFLKNEVQADINKMMLFDNYKHYTDQYIKHQNQIRLFFSNKPKDRYFEASLYDSNKFKTMNDHFNLSLKFTDEVHTHKSNIAPKAVIEQINR